MSGAWGLSWTWGRGGVWDQVVASGNESSGQHVAAWALEQLLADHDLNHDLETRASPLATGPPVPEVPAA